jgi:hypothetical protein
MDEAFAKSFATICKIFCNAQCDEFIHPEYLSRFYYILQQGLRFYQGDEVKENLIFNKKKKKKLSNLATFSSDH